MMALKPITIEKAVEFQFNALSRMVRNLLLENKNWKNQGEFGDKPSYYMEKYKTGGWSYHTEVVMDQANYILEQIEELKEFCIDMVKDPEP